MLPGINQINADDRGTGPWTASSGLARTLPCGSAVLVRWYLAGRALSLKAVPNPQGVLD